MWFRLRGDERINKRCASEGCAGQPTWRLEAGGVGSDYCSGCRAKIQSVWDKHGERLATQAMRAVHALQRADWINPYVENEDLADACMIIADAFAGQQEGS